MLANAGAALGAQSGAPFCSLPACHHDEWQEVRNDLCWSLPMMRNLWSKATPWPDLENTRP